MIIVDEPRIIVLPILKKVEETIVGTIKSIAKGLNIPYVPIEIDFKNRCFAIQEPKYITGTFEQESEKIASLFSGVEGATRTFKML